MRRAVFCQNYLSDVAAFKRWGNVFDFYLEVALGTACGGCVRYGFNQDALRSAYELVSIFIGQLVGEFLKDY